MLGAGFGLLRGVLIVGLAVIILQFLELDQDGWWQDARLRSYAEQVAAAIRYYAELGQSYLQGEVAVESAACGDFGIRYAVVRFAVAFEVSGHWIGNALCVDSSASSVMNP